MYQLIALGEFAILYWIAWEFYKPKYDAILWDALFKLLRMK